MESNFQNWREKLVSFQWAPKYERKQRQSSTEGSVMGVCTPNVATIRKENTIKHAADSMRTTNTRRAFVIDSLNKLAGVVSCRDIINFLGGGEKYNIIKEKHRGDVVAAINEHVREIMTPGVVSIESSQSFEEAVELLKKTGVGGIPVVRNKQLLGTVTEGKIINLISKSLTDQMVKSYMSKNVIFGSVGQRVSDLAKTMARNNFRRIPILQDRQLAGVVTATDIVFAFSKFPSAGILEKPASSLMKPPITVRLSATLADAAAIMTRHNISGLPVVSNSKVFGIITAKDLINAVEI